MSSKTRQQVNLWKPGIVLGDSSSGTNAKGYRIISRALTYRCGSDFTTIQRSPKPTIRFCIKCEVHTGVGRGKSLELTLAFTRMHFTLK